MERVTLWGSVVSGSGTGATFTQLPWVQAQFKAKLGIEAHPGTLNLRLDDPEALAAWRRLKAHPGVVIEPISEAYCEARGFPAVAARGGSLREGQRGGAGRSAGGQRVAIILPDVPGYPEDQVELIAPVNLREVLGLRDGDVVWVYVEVGAARE